MKSLVLHFPLIPSPGLDQPVELSFRVDCFGEVGVNVGLLYVFEPRLRVREQIPIAVALAEVEFLGSGHPVWHIITVLSGSRDGYVELTKYFLRWTATSEL